MIMNLTLKKAVGISAIGAVSLLELLHLQEAKAASASFTGSVVPNPHGGTVQVVITVDGSSGIFRMTDIATPVQPTGQNASYANFAIPTLKSEALASQSANINGVSGASQISSAWISSLSSAISAAASAGQSVGQASVVAPPAPTPTTPAPATTSQSPTTTTMPSGSTNVGAAPQITPFAFQPYTATTVINLNNYLSQISSAIAQLPTRSGGEGGSSTAATKSILSALQAQIQSDQTSSQTQSTALSSYIAKLNTQVAVYVALANQEIANYNASVQAAAAKILADAKASAAAIVASPAPTVTVTVTASPAAPGLVFKTGVVIKKTFTCVKTVSGVTTKKVVKAVKIKCPAGFTLLKR